MASCCYWLFCCCSGPAIANIPAAPSVTTDVGVAPDVGVPAMLLCSILLLTRVAKMPPNAAVGTGGKFAVGINDISGQ